MFDDATKALGCLAAVALAVALGIGFALGKLFA